MADDRLPNFNRRHYGCLGVIAFCGLILRLYGSRHGFGFHPDERHIIMVVSWMHWPDLNPKSFAYGSLPFYILLGLTRLLGLFQPHLASYDGCFIVGRTLSALFGAGTVFVTGLLAREILYSTRAAFVAALFLATNPFHIQNGHFYTVDGLLTLLITLCLVTICGFLRTHNHRLLVASAFITGLALSTKIAALSLGLPLIGAVWFAHQSTPHRLRNTAADLALVIVVAGLAVFVSMPYAVFDFPTFQKHLAEQSSMVSGGWVPPYTIQYQGTLPFIYHLRQMYLFTIGPLLFISAVAGCLLLASHIVSSSQWGARLSLIWTILFFSAIGGMQVKFPRYLLPLYPMLMIFAATAFLPQVSPLKRHRWIGAHLLLALAIGVSCFGGLRFLTIYSEPHSWFTASRWVFGNFPPGTQIIGEHWDDRLPISLPVPNGDAGSYTPRGMLHELPIYEDDREQKWAGICASLAEVDAIALPTARGYAAVPRQPERFPLTIAYYRALFAGALGFKLVQEFKVRPSLLGIELHDELGDESLSVYDHPKVVIFKKQAGLDATEICKIIKSHVRPFDWQAEWPVWMTARLPQD